MDNAQMPTVQPMPQSAPVRPGLTPQEVEAIMESKNKKSGLAKTIAIVILSLVAVTFMGLFVWIFMQYSSVSKDVEGRISDAVAKAKEEQALEDEVRFAEIEKEPYKEFSGPLDYGQLSFEYPKTWSVYISSDGLNGSDFRAYFNPGQVDAVGKGNIYALELEILNESFESVAARYQKYLEKTGSNLSMDVVDINGTAANYYTGTIPNTELNGYIVIFKIRDKTVIMSTDSISFKNDFDNIISTIKFNA